MAPGEHLPTEATIRGWPDFTAGSPMRILVSACLLGVPSGVDATSYGAPYRHLGPLLAGQGVCAAPLIRHGFPVVSPRDRRTLGRLIHKLDPTMALHPAARDHHQSDWYVQHLDG